MSTLALHMPKQGLKLVGHSGCKLEVKKVSGKYIVVKTAKDKAYGERLKKQAEKQQRFSHETFYAPRVLASGYNSDGLFAFKMEYIPGLTLAEHLKKVRVSEVERIAERFLQAIPQEFHFDPNAAPVFDAKLRDLEKNLKTSHRGTKKAIERLSTHKWEYALASACHGDLTLENIIYQDGDLYLIDFLDSFYDSWMMDMGKLLFDLESKWSYRHDEQVDKNLHARLSIFKESMLERLHGLPHGKNIVHEIRHLSLLHAVRILPYTTDEDTVKYLQENVNRLHDTLN
jgi:thiamine kinase-like enzyme